MLKARHSVKALAVSKLTELSNESSATMDPELMVTVLSCLCMDSEERERSEEIGEISLEELVGVDEDTKINETAECDNHKGSPAQGSR